MARFNIVVAILSIFIVLNAILILTQEALTHSNREAIAEEAGILPTKEESRVHLGGRRKRNSQLPYKRKINEDSGHEYNVEDEQTRRVDGLSQSEKDELGGETSEEKLHEVAGLDCDAYGGPSLEDAAEMIYWNDIPIDSSYVSPLKSKGPDTKYLTFEPDEGGWNNIRMSMETAVTLAHAMGRTLVLPPAQGMYLLHENKKGQKNRFTFSDFFHFDSVATEHAGVHTITMKQFLEREVMTGKMLDKRTQQPTFPPENRTDWDGVERHNAKKLDQWFRTFTNNPVWSFDTCVVGMPAKPGPKGPEYLNKLQQEVAGTAMSKRIKKYTGNPVPVDGSPEERLAEMYNHRRKICVYDEEFQNSKVMHMMGDNASGARLLVHFYAFLFFEDWKQDVWTKRFVRDHLRYVDEIQCAAARVVKAMRQKAREHGNEDGIFDTFHIRRGDFQYKDTRIDALQIYENIKDLVANGTTIYIATDERDKVFFKIFHQYYNVYFLDDFKDEIEGINTNFYGMLDQRIASRGRRFIGTFYSTFTGYINRMRGYHSQKDKAIGWEQGIIDSWYYVPKHTKDALQRYQPISNPMWAREFPVAWRDLDNGIDELAETAA